MTTADPPLGEVAGVRFDAKVLLDVCSVLDGSCAELDTSLDAAIVLLLDFASVEAVEAVEAVGLDSASFDWGPTFEVENLRNFGTLDAFSSFRRFLFLVLTAHCASPEGPVGLPAVSS